jgi:hypothetical protein
MRLCVDAFGLNSFPHLVLAEASGATFLATIVRGEWRWQWPAGAVVVFLVDGVNKHMLLKQYLESVLGLADDV